MRSGVLEHTSLDIQEQPGGVITTSWCCLPNWVMRIVTQKLFGVETEDTNVTIY